MLPAIGIENLSKHCSFTLLFFACGLFRFPVGFLGVLKSGGRMLQRLPGMFAAGLMILFAMMRGSHAVRVCSQFVKLRGSLMRILRHANSSLSIVKSLTC